MELLDIKEGRLEHVIIKALTGSKDSISYKTKQDLYDQLFDNALDKLKQAFSKMHYEAYFDKINNHFDDTLNR